ncbi:MAG: rod shape-determining protein MreC [Rhodospirillaceae bacterium]
MKQQAGPSARFSSLRFFLQKFAFVVLVAASFGLMMLGKADTVLVERIRVQITDAVAPVLGLLSEPAKSVAAVFDNFRELTAIREENARLLTENTRLLRWQAVARQLESENEALRGLLNYVPDPQPSFISAKVVADAGGTFARSLLVMAGTQNNVVKGQAVISGDGLVGLIAETGRTASRVLLLNDINSRVPVLIEGSGVKAILMGDNGDRPQLRFMRNKVALVPGDRIVTSGDARVFPEGVPIGVVASVDEKNGIRVQLFVEQERLEVVRLVDFRTDGILSEPTTLTGLD